MENPKVKGVQKEEKKEVENRRLAEVKGKYEERKGDKENRKAVENEEIWAVEGQKGSCDKESVGSSRLSEEANAILDLEETFWHRGGDKAAAIAGLGMSNTRYYLALNRVLANPQARMERPELVGRLIRLKERRARERRGPQGR